MSKVHNSSDHPFSSHRELIETRTGRRFVSRDEKREFAESDDVGRSLSQDVQELAKAVVKSGQGDKGDQQR